MADAFNAATPLDSDKARFGASELRAIKSRMDGIAGSSLSGMFAGRNRAVNPEFYFDQANEGVNYAAAGADVDGWGSAVTGVGVMGRIRSNEADGSRSRLLTVSTIDAAIAAGDVYRSNFAIEGYLIDDFLQGQATATGFTASFDVTASVAGNHSIAFRNNALSRSYVTTVNIPVAGVKTPISVRVPGDITGTWERTTSAGLYVSFDHGSGSTSVAPVLNAWQAGDYTAAAGSVQLISTLNSTFKLHTFQVEKGQIVTPVFEKIPYQMQLNYVMRYAEKSYDQGTATATITNTGIAVGSQITAATTLVYFSTINYKTAKRGVPALTIYNPAVANSQIRNIAIGVDYTGTGIFSAGQSCFSITGTTPGGSAVGNPGSYHWYSNARLL